MPLLLGPVLFVWFRFVFRCAPRERREKSGARRENAKGQKLFFFFCPKISSDQRGRGKKVLSLFSPFPPTFSRFILIVAERGDSGLWILGGGGGGRGFWSSREEEEGAPAGGFLFLCCFGLFWSCCCCCCCSSPPSPPPPPTKSFGASLRGLPLLRLTGGGGAEKNKDGGWCIFFFSLSVKRVVPLSLSGERK